MKRPHHALVFLPLLLALAGCPVTQSLDTPVPATRVKEQSLGRRYWLYVPSYYDNQRDWPLVVTLHGTNPYDTSILQIMEWKALAEEKGFIVAAPDLRGVEGVLPVPRSWLLRDLAEDERTILAVIDELSRTYRIDPKAILLTGFSAGGFPMYYVGLCNPERFNVLVARACNSEIAVFERIKVTEAARKLPIFIYWGRDDARRIRSQSWDAYRWLREHRFFNTHRKRIHGGHVRRPEIAYDLWLPHLPERHRE